MSVQSISSADSNAWWLDQLRKTSAADASTQSSTATQYSASLSPFGQLISKLDSLAASDPDKFKSLTTQIASELTAAAGRSEGPQADFLKQIAQKFTAASQSGDASGLRPARSGHHHSGHHRAAAYSAQEANSTSASSSPDNSQADGTARAD
jgi:hypothetical protein